MSPEEKHVRLVRRRNLRKGLDCFSAKYQVPIRHADGTLSVVVGNVGTNIRGEPLFLLPAGAFPLVPSAMHIGRTPREQLFVLGNWSTHD